MTSPKRVWREADLPAGMDGYARVVELAGGETVALIVTSSSLTPKRRAEVRRELLAEAGRKADTTHRR